MDVLYNTPYGNFEWDSQKNAINRKKHGVSFELACEVFADDFALLREDANHSDGEWRTQIIGQTLDGDILLLVVYTERFATRIISARLAEKNERKLYVNQK